MGRSCRRVQTGFQAVSTWVMPMGVKATFWIGRVLEDLLALFRPGLPEPVLASASVQAHCCQRERGTSSAAKFLAGSAAQHAKANQLP